MPSYMKPAMAGPAAQETSIMRLGFGCSGPWGMRWFSEKKAINLVSAAIKGGITHFDTGNFYGGGEAERRLGRALKALAVPREQLVLSTKTGTQLTGRRHIKDFSAETITHDIATSLARLDVEYLDIVYLHGPTHAEVLAAIETLGRFRKSGVIRKIGICSNNLNLDKWADDERIDAIMAPFNILDQTFLPIFIKAKAAGKHTAVITPLAQGLYRRRIFIPVSFSDIWYIARAGVRNREMRRRAQKFDWLHHQRGWSASQLALAFVLAHPCFDITFTTTSRISHLWESCRAADRVLPDEVRARFSHGSPFCDEIRNEI